MTDSKNEGLQVARAVAALTVAYFHSYVALRAWPEAAQMPIGFLKENGYLGVNFFFAISGYVICLVASKPDFTIWSFCIKRVFRLYPMYFAAMTVVAILIMLGKYHVEPIGHFLYSMTLLPQQGASAYDVSWSMEREVVFYAIAAVTIPLAGIPGLMIVLASLALIGFRYGNPWTFHVASTTQADFLAGAIVFWTGRYTARIGFLFPLLAGAMGLYFSMSRSIPFGPSASMGLLLIAFTNLTLDWQRWPARWLVAAGDASYSIYLLHSLTFIAMVQIAARLHLPDWMCEPWRYVTLAICCVLSHFTWSWIERPAIRFGNRLLQGNKPVVVAEAGI